MKSLILFALVVLLSGSEAFARETPAARLCRDVGGVAWTLDVGQVDDLQLCLLEDAQIAAASLHHAVVLSHWDTAVQVYRQGPATCGAAGGMQRRRIDSNGAAFQTCEFADGSAIGLGTLINGKDAPGNWKLTAVLGF